MLTRYDGTKQILEPRYEELEDLYLRYREAAERLVRDPDRFTPITLALSLPSSGARGRLGRWRYHLGRTCLAPPGRRLS